MHKPSIYVISPCLADIDWANNTDDKTPTSAYVVFPGTNPICWSLKKQLVVARSSIEV